MIYIKYFLLIFILFLTGCGKHGDPITVVTTRPIVAIVPVIDHSRHKLSWNISEELTQAIRQKLTQQNQLYLTSQEAILQAMNRKASQNHDPFGLETQWIKKAYPQHEFAAFFELVEHKEISTTEEAPAQLNISMRVRVFDLQGQEPKVILQELIEQAHHIPYPFTSNQTQQVSWNHETFEMSPLGIAHEKFCQELSVRIQEYILLTVES